MGNSWGRIRQILFKRRGAGRWKIFFANKDYSRFLEYMASAREKLHWPIRLTEVITAQPVRI